MCIRDSFNLSVMKRLIETIKNIFKIEELRKRILFTLSLILVYRFGSFVVIPGINPEALTDLQSQEMCIRDRIKV